MRVAQRRFKGQVLLINHETAHGAVDGLAARVGGQKPSTAWLKTYAPILGRSALTSKRPLTTD